MEDRKLEENLIRKEKYPKQKYKIRIKNWDKINKKIYVISFSIFSFQENIINKFKIRINDR